MKTIKITSDKIKTEQVCPTSKSYANRILILACLVDRKIIVKDLPESQDVKDLINILELIGIKFIKEDNSLFVLNSFPQCEKKTKEIVILPPSEGGTTIRFLLPVLALGVNHYEIGLSGQMAKRPIDNLLENLQRNNAIANKTNDKILIKGPLNQTGNFDIECEQTTQFASALLHLKVGLKLNYDYNLNNVGNSKKYLDLTQKLIESFKDTKKNEFIVPPDASSLGYFLVYAVLKQDLKLLNVISRDKFQADDTFFDILNKLEVTLTWDNGLGVKKKENLTHGFSVDGSQCIDLVPTLMLLASFIPFESQIHNVKMLEFKESNRLFEMIKILTRIGVNHSYDKTADSFIIFGKESYPSIENIDTADDHRMIMVSALFLKLLGGGNLSPVSGVKKSFNNFFHIFS